MHVKIIYNFFEICLRRHLENQNQSFTIFIQFSLLHMILSSQYPISQFDPNLFLYYFIMQPKRIKEKQMKEPNSKINEPYSDPTPNPQTIAKQITSKVSSSHLLSNHHVSEEIKYHKAEGTSSSFDIQDRFKSIKIPIPITNGKSEQGIKIIKDWLGYLVGNVFSQGFKLFEKGELSEKRARIFCCENILFNIIEMVRKNNLREEDIQVINKCFQSQLVPYNIMKCPKSQEKQINLSFANKISEIDNLVSINHDLVYRSKVRFIYKESGDYTSQIMKFLKFILNLPNEDMEKNEENQHLTLADCFTRDMEILFKKVQDKNQVKKMSKFNKRYPQKIKQLFPQDYLDQKDKKEVKQDKSVLEKEHKRGNTLEQNIQNLINVLLSQQKDKSKEDQEKDSDIEYAEKVREYTHHLIGRKLSKNIQNFKQNQIREGNLQINDSALLRILTKWCQELNDNYSNIEERQEPIRMSNGRQTFVDKDLIIYLSGFLKEEKKNVQEYMKNLMKNNFQNQKIICDENFDDKFSHFSEFESTVGVFSTLMLRNNKFYLLNYLHALIHGLAKASKIYYLATKNNMDHKLVRNVNEEELRNDLREEEFTNVPCLISFNVGDLLRCKCSSKQNQIIALFNELQRISYFEPSKLKIIRVKNKLMKETKDILINLLYKNTIVVQIQLAIKSEKSKFIQHSEKFNHFIYELQRSDFGPVMELCKIWMGTEPRAEFYQSQIKPQKIFRKNKGRKHQCLGRIRQMKEQFPFKCEVCNQFIYQSFIKRGKKCQNCKFLVCTSCYLNQIKSYEHLQKQLPQLPNPRSLQNYGIVNPIYEEQQIPDYGIAFKIRSKVLKPLKYFKIKNKDQILILTNIKNEYRQMQFQLIAYIRKKDNERKFRRHYIIITCNNVYNELANVFSPYNLQHYYYIPEMFKKIYKKQKIAVYLYDQSLFDWELQKLKKKYECFPKVTKVNLMHNYLTDLNIIADLFPNATTTLLWGNQIVKVQQYFFDKMKNIYGLGLGDNKIQEFDENIQSQSVGQLVLFQDRQLKNLPYKLKNLELLQLGPCSMKNLPPQIGNYQNLQYLTLQGSIQTICPQIGNCKNLNILTIQNCIKLQSFPSELGNCTNLQAIILRNVGLKQIFREIQNFIKLKEIKFQFLNIEALPESIGNCTSLEKLFIVSCPLSEIPRSLGNCINIINLTVENTEITLVPNQLQNLKTMREFTMKNNKIQYIPEVLCNCSCLQKMDFSQNNMKALPMNIGNLKSIKEINVEKNHIETIPQSIKNCANLQFLKFCFNNIKVIPQEVGKCENLRILQIGNNSIEVISEQIQNCYNLQKLDLCSNQIAKLPFELKKWKNLRYIDVEKNKINELPKSLGELESLEELKMKESLVKEIPDSIVHCKKLQKIHCPEKIKINKITLDVLKETGVKFETQHNTYNV